MSDDRSAPEGSETADRELSALIDGELSARREEELRTRIAREPALAARMLELERVDTALRALPVREPSEQLRERLQARIRAERFPRREAASSPKLRGTLAWLRGALASRGLWSGAALAAVAAAAVVYWTTGEMGEAGSNRAGTQGPRVADRGAPEPLPVELNGASDSLAGASEEELGIALEYDTLADLELLEELELLEILVALDVAERS
jgi:anti-sigma factor RsiW